MKAINYTIPVQGKSDQECDQKAEAISRLAQQLDGITLKALADKIPEILNDPFKSRIVRAQLGLI